jgi:hypothetical protein
MRSALVNPRPTNGETNQAYRFQIILRDRQVGFVSLALDLFPEAMSITAAPKRRVMRQNEISIWG